MKKLHFFLLFAISLAACNRASGTGQTAPTSVPPEIAGRIIVDGSSTVGPITIRVADEFNITHPNVDIQVFISGTSGGFRKFCAGETDISDASRPINESETALCAENGIEYVEIPVAYDGLAVLANPDNEFLICLTVAQLKSIWEPASEGVIQNWDQVDLDFPARPLVLFGAGFDSGTYDYFTEAIVGEAGASRTDFFGSEDDNKLVQGVANEPNALGFFGYAYYDQNRDKLKLISVDSGKGCVEPNTETVARGLYTPLSRPLFIYINRDRIDEKPEISGFIAFYLANAVFLVDDVGYIPLTDQIYQLAQERFNLRVIGSVFEGLGSSVGISLADLLAREQ